MTRYLATLLLAFSAVALGSSGNISKVSGSINVEAGQQAGDVSTVNGSITIREDARVRDAETVNGSIKLHPRAEAHGVETVNGSIDADDFGLEPEKGFVGRDLNGEIGGGDARINLDTVNGSIRINKK